MSSRSLLTPTLATSIVLIIGLVVFIMTACVAVSPPLLPPTLSPLWTLVLTFTPTPTATPTVTSTATPMLFPTATPTPTPTPVQLSVPFVGPTGQLAYVEGGRLVVVGLDDNTTVVAEENVAHDAKAVVWSPDGHRLLYVTEKQENIDKEYHIWDNATKTILYLNQEIPDFPPGEVYFYSNDWSPDSMKLLFRSGEFTSHHIWVVDIKARRFWRVAEGTKISPSSWVNTSTILYRENLGIFSETLHLINIAAPMESLTNVLSSVGTEGLDTLSPDKHYVAWTESSGEPNQRLRIAPLLPDYPALAPSTQPTVTTLFESPPCWSPDGRWIVYPARAMTTPKEGLYTVLVDTTGVSATRVITDFFPHAWSPDGRLLAGCTCYNAFGCGLIVADVFSDQVVLIDQDGEMSPRDIAWSPQGTYLAYSLAGPNSTPGELMLWDRAAGERRLLMQGSETGPFTHLQWSPDGCYLHPPSLRNRQGVSPQG